jgi:hypothetical protein
MIRLVVAAGLVLAIGWAGGEPGAPQRLNETGLYAAGPASAKATAGQAQIGPANRPFSPQYPLWSDGAAKSRWIYLPPGTAIDTTDPDEWAFPVGTRFWKEFTFNGRKVETRFLWRASAGRWVFATYVWNEEQNDAVLAPDEGVRGVVDVGAGRRHDIPGANDCRACHGSTRPGPLGFNALQLSTDRDPNAIHGEPLAPGMITLGTLVNERLLSPARPELLTNPPRIQASSPRTRSAIGYFTSNCGTCHNPGGETSFTGPSLKHSDVADGDAVVKALMGYATRWQVPGQPEGGSFMLNGEAPDASAMLARMRSRRPSSQMPPLGTNLRDDRAIEAISKWIAADLGRRD